MMPLRWQYLQILGSIVSLISVNVMHDLTRLEIAFEDGGRDQAMRGYSATGNPNSRIWIVFRHDAHSPDFKTPDRHGCFSISHNHTHVNTSVILEVFLECPFDNRLNTGAFLECGHAHLVMQIAANSNVDPTHSSGGIAGCSGLSTRDFRGAVEA
jgi:hypothetical protein